MRPVSSLVLNPPIKVVELIDATSASWKEELIRQIFTPVDAEAILRIPICSRPLEDFWAWSEDPRGRFSVRTAYKMIFRIKMGREAWLEESESLSNVERERKGWNDLWKIKVPSKLKVFAWRLSQHSF